MDIMVFEIKDEKDHNPGCCFDHHIIAWNTEVIFNLLYGWIKNKQTTPFPVSPLILLSSLFYKAGLWFKKRDLLHQVAFSAVTCFS